MMLARTLSLSCKRVVPATTTLGRKLYSTAPPTTGLPAFDLKEHRQWIVMGYDGKDEKALERRMAARPSHMSRAKQMKKNGKMLYGGAILDNNGKMIGSVMLMNDMNEQEVKKTMEEDPYVKDKVWDTHEIKPYRLADLD